MCDALIRVVATHDPAAAVAEPSLQLQLLGALPTVVAELCIQYLERQSRNTEQIFQIELAPADDVLQRERIADVPHRRIHDCVRIEAIRRVGALLGRPEIVALLGTTSLECLLRGAAGREVCKAIRIERGQRVGETARAQPAALVCEKIVDVLGRLP